MLKLSIHLCTQKHLLDYYWFLLCIFFHKLLSKKANEERNKFKNIFVCFIYIAQKYKLNYAGQLNHIETMKSKSLCFDIRMRIYFDFDMNIIRINLLVWPRLIIHNDVHWWIGVDTSGHETHYTATWDMCHISGGITSS